MLPELPSLEPETIQQLLTLPQYLESISPPLAALHLARVRLLLNIPLSTIEPKGWCGVCGGLRIHKQKGQGKGKQMSNGGTCSHCGSNYRRPKPILDRPAYSPARLAVRTRRMKEATMIKHPHTLTTAMASSSRNAVASLEERLMQRASELDIIDSSNPPRPTLLRSPSLSYIPHTSPNPPTYPQPSFERSGVHTAKKSGKKKKSGLARLLAEGRERVAAEEGGKGSWGLG